MAQFNDDALWSAVKRKNVQDVLAFVFTECGYDAAAEVAKNTTRMTDQAITRMREALDAPVETEVEEVDQTELDTNELDTNELDTNELAEEMVENKLITLEKDIVDAIKKGKRKKAKKAWDALAATGARGSVMKDLKRQIKKLEK